MFSAARIAVELTYDLLAATGRTGSTVWLHAVWLVALAPALVVGARLGGVTGVAAAHAVVVAVVLLPLLAWLLRSSGMRLRELAVHNLRPVLGVLALMVPAPFVLAQGWPELAEILVGSAVGGLAYLAVVWPMRKSAIVLWNMSR